MKLVKSMGYLSVLEILYEFLAYTYVQIVWRSANLI